MTVSEKKSIVSFIAKTGIREYSEGYKLYEMRRGFGAGREIKASLFFFLAMGMLFILMTEGFDITRLPVCAVILLICMHMCIYYIFMMPGKAKHIGEHIYKSSEMIGKTYSYDFCREYFVMKNKYHYLKRYYDALEIDHSEHYCELHGFSNCQGQWFYSWDVDSILIWNPDVVVELKEKENAA